MSLLEFILAKQRTLLEVRSEKTEKTASQNENLQFAVHLELGRDLEEAWKKVGKGKPGLGEITRGVQPAARGLHVARDGFDFSPTESHKFT